MQSDDPVAKAIELVREANTNEYKIFKEALDYNGDPIENNLRCIRNRVINSTRTKSIEYLKINPSLKVPNFYKCKSQLDFKRIQLTRFWLGSHNLYIERGRWLRKLREERVCQCDNTSIQDEEHVAISCILTNHVRISYNLYPISLVDFFENNEPVIQLSFINDIMKNYDWILVVNSAWPESVLFPACSSDYC